MQHLISLPAGAFQPFGRSASKTCILAVVKKGENCTPPKYVFGAIAHNIGYDTGKTTYKTLERNDLIDILKESKSFFSGVHHVGQEGSTAAWCHQTDITADRIDAGYIISQAREDNDYVPLGDIFDVADDFTPLTDDREYSYLEVPWISDIHGCIQRIDRKKGSNTNASRLRALNTEDIYLTRINPRKQRIGMVPKNAPAPIMVSGEVYTLKWKPNDYIPFEARFAIIPILRSEYVTQQICNLSTGSSSSRARISVSSLEGLRIPSNLLQNQTRLQKQSETIRNATNTFWEAIRSVNSVMESIQ